MQIAVTGASGLLGRHVIAELLRHGYKVRQIDLVRPGERRAPHRIADLRDLGQTCGALYGCDGVVHLAAVPSLIGYSHDEVFKTNVVSSFNVLEAAAMLGITRVVVSSSAAALGVTYAFRPVALRYLPVDEAHPALVQDPYGLSKIVGEELCAAFHRRTGGTTVSLRFPAIWDSQAKPDLLRRLSNHEPTALGTLWSYVEVRDAARACRLALEAPNLGAEVLYIAAPQTFVVEPSVELARRYFPTAEIRGPENQHWSFYDCSRAAQVLGFQAEHPSISPAALDPGLPGS